MALSDIRVGTLEAQSKSPSPGTSPRWPLPWPATRPEWEGGLRPTLIMGILNTTPDSFSDGGRFAALDDALDHAGRMVADGADILDIGGESTRPGAACVTEDEEMARVIPLIAALRSRSDVPLSIDTRKSAVARAAVAAGATVWNDVSALTGSADSLQAAAEMSCDVVLMHMQGQPATMQIAPRYDDAAAEVISWLAARADAVRAAGVARQRIWLDPGLGFGKTLAHNLSLLAALDQIVALGFPVLLGASRKGMIHALDPAAACADDRLGGSLALALAGARAGCAMVRVHDVRETVQALKVARAIERARRPHA